MTQMNLKIKPNINQYLDLENTNIQPIVVKKYTFFIKKSSQLLKITLRK